MSPTAIGHELTRDVLSYKSFLKKSNLMLILIMVRVGHWLAVIATAECFFTYPVQWSYFVPQPYGDNGMEFVISNCSKILDAVRQKEKPRKVKRLAVAVNQTQDTWHEARSTT